MPDDRTLMPVYNEQGQLVHNRYGISAGWLQELIDQLKQCEEPARRGA